MSPADDIDSRAPGAGAAERTVAAGGADGGSGGGMAAIEGLEPVLLVVLEPRSGTAAAMPPAAATSTVAPTSPAAPTSAGDAMPAGSVLLVEGDRLARKLGVEARFVTWPAEAAGGADLQAVAAAISAVAARVRPLAVVMADTEVGRRLAPLLAHRLDSGAVVGCADVLASGVPVSDSAPAGSELARAHSVPIEPPPTGSVLTKLMPAKPVFVKPTYGGWLEREIVATEGTVPVISLNLAGLEEPALDSMEALRLDSGESLLEIIPLERREAAGMSQRVRHIETVPPDPKIVDLVHAKRIVAVGSGSTGERPLIAAQELADLLEGSVGATRPVVDDGLLPKERLIGQTGRTVTPDLYVALGISGSPHHVAGVRNAERILSINKDPRAPMFQFSDIGFVADLEAVLPALVEKIKEWRDDPVAVE